MDKVKSIGLRVYAGVFSCAFFFAACGADLRRIADGIKAAEEAYNKQPDQFPPTPTPTATPTAAPMESLKVEPTAPKTQVGKPSVVVTCKALFPARDGFKNGFIFLQSKNMGVAKAIFPSRFVSQFGAVVLQDKLGKRVDSLTFSAFANPDNTGKPRQHWTAHKSTSKLQDDLTLNADGNCWKLGKMSERID